MVPLQRSILTTSVHIFPKSFWRISAFFLSEYLHMKYVFAPLCIRLPFANKNANHFSLAQYRSRTRRFTGKIYAGYIVAYAMFFSFLSTTPLRLVSLIIRFTTYIRYLHTDSSFCTFFTLLVCICYCTLICQRTSAHLQNQPYLVSVPSA